MYNKTSIAYLGLGFEYVRYSKKQILIPLFLDHKPGKIHG
jgi:hypothetical protein